ncbi:MAG TPA: inorganic diphosphatase [Candidatus Paceibacterota bacterium]|nr:inorganic diphosphatase [Candidatus Paceibacterota bacterium]
MNYGFVPGTLSPDGEELDAYVLEVDKPVHTFSGICIAIIHRASDDDDKLALFPQKTKTKRWGNSIRHRLSRTVF